MDKPLDKAKPMSSEEAIKAIRSNWPDERYSMLREALEAAIGAMEEVRQLREERDSFQRVGIKTMEERDHLIELLKVMKIHIKVGNFEFALMDIDEAISQYSKGDTP